MADQGWIHAAETAAANSELPWDQYQSGKRNDRQVSGDSDKICRNEYEVCLVSPLLELKARWCYLVKFVNIASHGYAMSQG